MKKMGIFGLRQQTELDDSARKFRKELMEEELAEQVEKYKEELKEAGSDYNAIKRVQEKYAHVFEDSGTDIIKNNPKVEPNTSNRIYLNGNNKALIKNSYANAGARELRHMDHEGLCQVCGNSFSGLGIYCIPDSVEICIDCTTEENYVDFDEIVLCDFGG